MMRKLGRKCGWTAWTCAWLLLGGGATAQTPEQHWQATPNYPANNGPTYQPSNAQGSPVASGNPAAGAPAAGQYQNQQPPDQPVGPPQYPSIEHRQPVVGYPPADNRGGYPPNPQGQGTSGPGAALAGPPTSQTIQGPPVQTISQQAPFTLSPQEAAALENLLTDWEKRNKEIHDLESDFYRWKYDATFGNGKPPTPEKGVLKFHATDKGLMSIDAKEPVKSEKWVCDGKSIYQFNYADRKIKEFIMPPEMQGKGIGDGPLPFVFGVEAEKLKQRYFMRIITPPDVHDAVWLEAYPRYQKQAADFSKVQVILQLSGPEKVLLPFAIQMFLPGGKDRHVYQLQDPKINPKGTWLPIPIERPWWVTNTPWGWEKQTELPPRPVEVGLNPAGAPRH